MTKLVCPNGHRAGRVRIVHGLPTPETMEAAERGEVVLGGRILTGDDPEWACRACHEPLQPFVQRLRPTTADDSGRMTRQNG